MSRLSLVDDDDIDDVCVCISLDDDNDLPSHDGKVISLMQFSYTETVDSPYCKYFIYFILSCKS